MPYTQRLETHFPVQVLVRQHQGVERMNAELHAHIADMRKRHASTSLDAVFMRQCTTQGGFQTTPMANLFDDPAAVVCEFRASIIEPAVDDYLKSVFEANPANVKYRLHGWANILRAGDWQAPHMHPTEIQRHQRRLPREGDGGPGAAGLAGVHQSAPDIRHARR